MGIILLMNVNPAQADVLEVKEEFLKGVIREISEVKSQDDLGFERIVRIMAIEVEEEGESKQVIAEEVIGENDPRGGEIVAVGDKVVVSRMDIEGDVKYTIMEPYRLNGIFIILFLFIILIILITGKKGLLALLGLSLSFLILIKWLIPQVVSGKDPVLLSFIAAIAICTVTFYLGHGFKKRTSLALLSTLGTLTLAFALSVVAIKWVQLSGAGTEEAFSLNFGGLNIIDLRGLLLGAIVIGTLGVLDDVTVTQIATVHQIHRANENLSFRELYKRGLSVGKDHIASIINTLVLAYAGASFPTLILLVTSPWPLWMTLNNEFMAEEIVRTLVGSMTLVLAVPISTLMAAYFYSRQKNKDTVMK